MTALHGNVPAGGHGAEHAGRCSSWPVGRTSTWRQGAPTPLLRPLETTPETHGPHGLGYAALPAPVHAASDRFGPDVIVEAARRQPGELTLVTLGPLTNLAIAVLAEPRLPRLLRRWVAMAGAFRVPGNTTPVSEWNVHCDPEAARIALGAWQAAVDADGTTPRAMLMGLDVTERARLLPAHLDAARRARGGETARSSTSPATRCGSTSSSTSGTTASTAPSSMTRSWWRRRSTRRSCALEPASVDVDARGGPGDGQTIADWRQTTGRRPNVDVALAGEADAFLDRLVERVGGLARARRH